MRQDLAQAGKYTTGAAVVATLAYVGVVASTTHPATWPFWLFAGVGLTGLGAYLRWRDSADSALSNDTTNDPAKGPAPVMADGAAGVAAGSAPLPPEGQAAARPDADVYDFSLPWIADTADVSEHAVIAPPASAAPAFTGRWRHTADGFMASPLTNMASTAMPGYFVTADQMPFVRIGVCIASDPIPAEASSGQMGDRFIAFLNRDPVAAFVSGLIQKESSAWVRQAGNGALLLEAVLGGDTASGRPSASAMLLTPVIGMRNYGRADGLACLWLHIEPRARDGSPQAFTLAQWHGHCCRAVAVAAALAEYLTEGLGLTTHDEPSARVGIMLNAGAAMSELVNTEELCSLPGAARSSQFLGYLIADASGRPDHDAVRDLLRQLCDHTLHLGGDFEKTLHAIAPTSQSIREP